MRRYRAIRLAVQAAIAGVTIARAGNAAGMSDGFGALPAAAGSALKADTGTITIAEGQSGTVSISGLVYKPAAILFYLTGGFQYITTTATTGLPDAGATVSEFSKMVGLGAYDGVSQWTQMTGASFYGGRREGTPSFDSVVNWDEQDFGGGLKLVATSMNADGATFSIVNGIVTGQGPTIIKWVAIGGCRAKVGRFSVPGNGNYYGNIPAPQGIAVTGVGFRPKAIIGSVFGISNDAGAHFFTITGGPSMGFASGTTTARQAGVGASMGYLGCNASYAYDGPWVGDSRLNQYGPPSAQPSYLARLKTFDSDGFTVDFQKAWGDFANDGVCYIALDCLAYAGQVALPTSVGAFSITGAGFTPKVLLTSAAPRVETNEIGPGAWPNTDMTLKGNINISLGVAINDGINTQFCTSFFDQGSPDESGTAVNINGDNTHTPPSMHDAFRSHFTGLVTRGTVRTDFRTFTSRGQVSLSGFLADGVQLNVVESSGRAGLTAFLMLGGGVPDLGQNAALNGYKVLPADSEWYADVSARALDANASKYINVANPSFAASDGSIDPNWSFIVEASPAYGGIPYYVVDTSTEPKRAVIRTAYLDDSDYGPFPIPFAAKIEGDPADVGSYGYSDRHLLALDRATGFVYQFFGTNGGGYVASSDGVKWRAKSTGIFDNVSNEPRRYGLDSGDAAGACLLAGIIRYDEIVAGVINHAARFTTRRLGIYYCNPAMKTATSGAGYNYWKFTATAGQTVFTLGGNTLTNTAQLRVAVNGTILSSGYSISGGGATLTLSSGLSAGDFLSVTNWTVPAGIHLRLKASFNISGYSATNQIILTALKKYGMINCDTGSDLAVTGDADPRWNQADLNALTALRASDFEVVAPPNIYHLERSPGQSDGPPAGSAPTISSFTASAASVPHGNPVTLSWSVSGATGVAITPDVGAVKAGVTSIVVNPQYDTIYKLVATNRWGRVSKHVDVETT